MGWFSNDDTDEARRKREEQQSRRAISESKARQLRWAEKEFKKDPGNRLAKGILDANRNNL